MNKRRISPRLIAANLAGMVLPRGMFQMHGPASSRAVALTFDDGPHPDLTPRLLDALRDAGAVATFFLVGNKVEKHPEIVRRIVAEGHAIGTHSFTHPRPEAIDAAGLVAETHRTNEALQSIVGRKTNLFRPPFGGLSIKKLRELWKIKQSLVFWSIDPKDFACETTDQVRTNLRRRPLRGGDIILMHDNIPFGAELVPEIAADVKRLGLRFTTPDAWNRPRS
jgi:peptidoglycan/xylan/chitin deacetylase (PgdA/CDA1 family)